MPECVHSSETTKQPLDGQEVLKKLKSTDESIIDSCLSYMKELLTREGQRRSTADEKANTLLGFSGITSALVLGLGSFLFDLRNQLPLYFLIPFILFYILITVVFILTIWHGFKALHVREYSDVHPENIYEFQSDKTIEMKKKWIASLLVAYQKNAQETNEKVTNLLIAQKYFGIGIMLLVVLAFIVSISVFVSLPPYN